MIKRREEGTGSSIKIEAGTRSRGKKRNQKGTKSLVRIGQGYHRL